MTNTEIINTHPSLLGTLDRQRRACICIAKWRMPCPHCGETVNQIEASGLDLDAFPVDNTQGVDFTCPQCKAPLTEAVPITGPPYFWQAKIPA